MRVLIDLSDVVATSLRAELELAGIPDLMKRTVAMGAAYERMSHAYRNRTGRLQASTREVVVSRTRRLSQVNLEMGMHYASYVRGRGLSNIDSAANRVTAELTERFSEMARRIAG